MVESERDVESLCGRGLVATTNPGGAGKWPYVADTARKVLAGRHVVILPDADEPGRKHAADVKASLQTWPQAC